MSKTNDGGPVFPTNSDPVPGIALRDYFAAKILPAVFSDYCNAARETGFDYGWRIGLAMDAYEMADAMLEVRQK